jgi:hypothetical protein
VPGSTRSQAIGDLATSQIGFTAVSESLPVSGVAITRTTRDCVKKATLDTCVKVVLSGTTAASETAARFVLPEESLGQCSVYVS